MTKLTISFLKAFNGDCIHISFTDNEGLPRNILIDGGIGNTYQTAKSKKGKPDDGDLKILLTALLAKGQRIDLLIVTHVDDDHIGGILRWFDYDAGAAAMVSEVFFNTGGLIAEQLGKPENPHLIPLIYPDDDATETSIADGIDFGKHIIDAGIWNNELILQGKQLKRFDLVFSFLSPDQKKLENLLKEWKKKDPDLETASHENDYSLSLKDHLNKDLFEEDNAPANGSSISFILTANEKHFLFLGDAHPSVIIKGLEHLGYTKYNRIKSAVTKLSHHGSKGNTSRELLQMIDSDSYVISTDGNLHQHPHKQFLARLIDEKKDSLIYFNYEERLDIIFTPQDRKDFPDFKTAYLSTPMDFAL
jgi:hypothetical protein